MKIYVITQEDDGILTLMAEHGYFTLPTNARAKADELNLEWGLPLFSYTSLEVGPL